LELLVATSAAAAVSLKYDLKAKIACYYFQIKMNNNSNCLKIGWAKCYPQHTTPHHLTPKKSQALKATTRATHVSRVFPEHKIKANNLFALFSIFPKKNQKNTSLQKT